MTCYLVQPRDRIFVDLCLLLKIWVKILKNISKSLSIKCNQELLGYAKRAIQKTTSKRAIQKIAETTGDLISNKIANKIANVSGF